MKRLEFIFTLALLGALTIGDSVFAQTDAFYKGKTLQILVASGPGAGNDLKTRIFARHAPKYLPGAPNVIVENMPGAGGLRARNQFTIWSGPTGSPSPRY